ncbi:hypothetical protein ccbrp13_66330 [Ktedonobacteria bacterium brp13]|nr:hypothetical protein ccbrp13_66330 [Ktedonobacteria bacterium brp13]
MPDLNAERTAYLYRFVTTATGKRLYHSLVAKLLGALVNDTRQEHLCV